MRKSNLLGISGNLLAKIGGEGWCWGFSRWAAEEQKPNWEEIDAEKKTAGRYVSCYDILSKYDPVKHSFFHVGDSVNTES